MILLACATTHPARAQGNPDAARPIVAEHCVACHKVPGYRSRHDGGADIGPPFQAIADQPPVYTRARLTAFLRKPHFPMTKFILSPSDIDNLVAFIESLRDRD